MYNYTMMNCAYHTADMVGDHIAPATLSSQGISVLAGDCQSRDVFYSWSGTDALGVSVGAGQIENYFEASRPFCIALLLDTEAGNSFPVVSFYTSEFAQVGQITPTATELNFGLGDENIQFPVIATGTKRYQLCWDGISNLTLYTDCEFTASMEFSPTINDISFMQFMRGIGNDTFQVNLLHVLS